MRNRYTTLHTHRTGTRIRRQQHCIGPQPPDVVVEGSQPLMELRIYQERVLVTRRDGQRAWRQYFIDPDALAQTLSKTPVQSGLLPPNVVATGRNNAGVPFYVQFIPAQRWRMQTTTKLYRLPLPPLIWAGCGRDWRIWALDQTDYPTRGNTPLWVVPMPNTYKNGSICWGEAQPPEVASHTLEEALRLLLEDSQFNAHMQDYKSAAYPVSITAQWDALEAAEVDEYPLNDLYPAEMHLSEVISGHIWRQ